MLFSWVVLLLTLCDYQFGIRNVVSITFSQQILSDRLLLTVTDEHFSFGIDL